MIRKSIIALGLALIPVVGGVLMRTARHLPWKGLDWRTVALIALATAVTLAAVQLVDQQRPRAIVLRVAKNVSLAVLFFLGLVLANSVYRIMLSIATPPPLNHRAIALGVLVGGAILGICTTWLESKDASRG